MSCYRAGLRLPDSEPPSSRKRRQWASLLHLPPEAAGRRVSCSALLLSGDLSTPLVRSGCAWQSRVLIGTGPKGILQEKITETTVRQERVHRHPRTTPGAEFSFVHTLPRRVSTLLGTLVCVGGLWLGCLTCLQYLGICCVWL